MKLTYYAILHPCDNGGFAVEVPDVPGCFSMGKDLDECQEMTQEALREMLECFLEDGDAIPPRSGYPEILEKTSKEMGPVAVVMPVTVYLTSKIQHICITIPDSLQELIGDYIRSAGGNRSGLIAQAVTEYISRRSKSGSAPVVGASSNLELHPVKCRNVSYH